MNWKTKLLTIISIILIIGILLFIIKYQYDTISKLSIIEKSMVEQKKIGDNITRAQSSYLTKKDFDRFAKDNGVNLKVISEDLDKLQADVKGISITKIITNGYYGNNIESSGETINTDIVNVEDVSKFGYLKNRQYLSINEGFQETKVPFGEVGFSAWKERPWDLKIYPREYLATNVLGMDEDGKHYVYSKFSIVSNGKKIDLNVSESKFVEEFPESKFRFSPRFYAGIDSGAYFSKPTISFTPNFQMFLFSKGLTKVDPDWIFLGLGGGYDFIKKDIVFTISPLSYNIGHHIPMVNNIFIGPTLGVTPFFDISAMIGVKFGL